MPKKCNDPVCPANKYLASTSKPRKAKTKKAKKPSRKISATTSRAPKPEKRRSKCSSSKKRSQDRAKRSRTPSRIKICKNKKCQSSKPAIESSTSTNTQTIWIKSLFPSIHRVLPNFSPVVYSPETGVIPDKKKVEIAAVKSRKSVKSSKSGPSFLERRPGTRTICHCKKEVPRKPRSTARRKRKKKSCSWCKCKTSRRRESDRDNKLLNSLCICATRSTSRGCKHPSSCALLSKYSECCCTQNKGKRNVKSGQARSKSRSDKSRGGLRPQKCPCTPSTAKKLQNVIRRGWSNVYQRLQKLRNSFSRPQNCECRLCSSKISRNRSGRSVKFCK